MSANRITREEVITRLEDLIDELGFVLGEVRSTEFWDEDRENTIDLLSPHEATIKALMGELEP